MTREIDWLIDRLLEEYPFLSQKRVKNHPELTGREWLELRISWGIPKGFVYFWGDIRGTYGGIMIRPVNDELLVNGSFNYFDTIFDFDPQGEICWVDFAYGPGLYPKMITLCQSTGCAMLGWRHRNRVHLVPFEKIPKTTMMGAFH
jgi:hypothetical protein